MKKLFLFLILLTGLSTYSFAQSPQGFKYQAVARDATNQPYQSTNLGVRISLIRDGVSGVIDYSESHMVTTTDLGVFDLSIGNGTPLNGTFSTLNWGAHAYYLKVDIDPAGGTSYINMGVSQLLSVPYALYAREAGSGSGGDADNDPNNELQTLIYNPTTQQLSISDGNSINLNIPTGSSDDQVLTLTGTTLSIEDGNSIDLAVLQDGTEDADADPSNELQDISFNPATNELSISNGSTVTLPSGGTDADADPTNELQTINKSGNTVTLSDGGGSFTDDVDDADADPGNELQDISFNPATNELSISNGSTVTLPSGGTDADADPTNELQDISLTGTNLSITDGSTLDLSVIQDGVDDADADPGNELQDISFNPATNELSISNGSTVTLPSGGTDADADPMNELQTISKSGNTVTLSDGGGSFTDEVDDADNDPSNEIETWGTLAGIPADIADGDDVDDADADPNNEIQSLSFNPGTSELTISGSNTVTIPTGGTDADADPTNELQDISLSGTNLSISDGSTLDLSVIQDGVDDADADPNNEIQVLSLTGDQLSLSNGGGDVTLPGGSDDQTLNLTGTNLSIEDGNSIDLSTLQDGVDDADADPTNEIQTISKSGNTVTLSNGGGSFTDEVDDDDANPNNELQTLSLTGNNLSLSNGGGNVSLAGFGNLWSQNGSEIYYNSNGVGIGTADPEDEMGLHLASDVLIQSNLAALHIGYPNNGNRWRLSTFGGGEDLIFRSKPSGTTTYTTRFSMNQSGEFILGNTTTPRGWMHLRENSTTFKPQLFLEETQDDYARLGFGNTAHTAQWHIAATARDGASGPGNSRMNFWFTNDQGAADRFTITGGGLVGIGNTDPDENLVVGSNLGSGWALPAVTVGGSNGGAFEAGNPTVSISVSASSTFDRARIISSDGNGFGQGFIEMRTRQLNVGRSPGISSVQVYPLRVVQNVAGQGGNYGFAIYNGTDASNRWEFYVGTDAANDGDMALYFNNANRGSFDSASGNYTPTSDKRLKTNIKALSGVLPALLQLKPKTYQYKTRLGHNYVGFLAQELQDVFPELVSETKPRNEGEESVLLVDYSQLTVLAITALQEQQEVIEAQNEKIENLEERLARLEALIQK